MKIRNGYVSNSSSSSFVVLKDALTEQQIDMVLDYRSYIDSLIKSDKEINQDNYIFNKTKDKYDSDRKPTLEDKFEYYDTDPWKIEEYQDFIFGETSMDNFGMEEYFDYIKINSDYIKWSEGYNDKPYPDQINFIRKMKNKIRKHKINKINKK